VARSTRFGRRKGRPTLTVNPDEAALLTDLLEQLVELVAPQEPDEADPLAAMVDIGTSTRAPEDPVLARLFPDAYPDDDEASGDFRRYTEPTLRRKKQDAALLALVTLEEPGRERALTPEQVEAWLGALNDLRLALGTRLEVSEDNPLRSWDLPPDDPSTPLLVIYEWLTYLQDSLIGCLG
jgi:hypothetical protein